MNTVKKKRNMIFLVWLMPIIALVVSVSMMYQSYMTKGVEIVINFKDASGFEKIKTAIKYRGVRVGYVKSVSVNPNNINQFKVVAVINKQDSNYIVRAGTKFWKKSVKIGKDGVSGLSTIIKGNHIELLPASTNPKTIAKTPKKYEFEAISNAPNNQAKLISDGIELHLKADKTYQISRGDKIYFKGFEAGIVDNVEFDSDSEIVDFDIIISEKFKDKIGKDTKFYINNAVDLKLNTKQLSLKIAPLGQMIQNSISFINEEKQDKITNPKDHYNLYGSFGDINLKNKTKIITLRSNHLNSMKVQAPILYKGLPIGKIAEIEYDKRHDNFKFFVAIDDKFSDKIASNSHFVIKSGIDIKMGFDGIKLKTESLEDMLFGGIELINLSSNETKRKSKKEFWLHTTDEFESIKEDNQYISVYLCKIQINSTMGHLSSTKVSK
jgi:paraquat-inducible protein B